MIPNVEIAYRLAKNYWRRGIGTKAAKAIKKYVFKALGIDTVISIIDPKNTRSIKVAKKIGMLPIKSTTLHGYAVEIYASHKIALSP